MIAGLYPLITDGLALVAYAATARLSGPGRRYAWTVVVLAAGLSGLAQAAYLAGGVESAPAALRFGVGAWPAIAAAIVAHLLFLLATDHHTQDTAHRAADADEPTPAAGRPHGVHRSASGRGPAVQSAPEQPTVQPSSPGPAPVPAVPVPPSDRGPSGGPGGGAGRSVASPARDRAERVALAHRARHGALPTVTQLVTAAEVSRGTAGETLKALRARSAALHVIRPRDETSRP